MASNDPSDIQMNGDHITTAKAKVAPDLWKKHRNNLVEIDRGGIPPVVTSQTNHVIDPTDEHILHEAFRRLVRVLSKIQTACTWQFEWSPTISNPPNHTSKPLSSAPPQKRFEKKTPPLCFLWPRCCEGVARYSSVP